MKFPTSLLILTLLSAAAPLAAQLAPDPAPPAAPSPAAAPRKNLYTLLVEDGGILMYPLFVCSLVVLTVGIERTISLRRRRTAPPGLLDAVFAALPAESSPRSAREEALGILAASRSTLGRLLALGVEKLPRGFHLCESHLEEELQKEAHRLKRTLRPFAIMAQVAPLLGLLGTIYGMIVCFEETVAAESASRAETLASGIYQALITTAAGLTIAIPALAFYHYFLGRADRLVDQLEAAATAFLERYFEEAPAVEISPRRTASLPETAATKAHHRSKAEVTGAAAAGAAAREE
jgi:biopolymer transport protein ExbB